MDHRDNYPLHRNNGRLGNWDSIPHSKKAEMLFDAFNWYLGESKVTTQQKILTTGESRISICRPSGGATILISFPLTNLNIKKDAPLKVEGDTLVEKDIIVLKKESDETVSFGFKNGNRSKTGIWEGIKIGGDHWHASEPIRKILQERQEAKKKTPEKELITSRGGLGRKPKTGEYRPLAKNGGTKQPASDCGRPTGIIGRIARCLNKGPRY